MSITEDQRIAILVYKEDHPEAYPPEISEATGISYRDVVHVLREYEAGRTRYQVRDVMEYFSKEDANKAAAGLFKAGGTPEVEDVTPCAFKVNHGPGGQSETYCERTGPHEDHAMNIMGTLEEFDKDGKSIF